MSFFDAKMAVQKIVIIPAGKLSLNSLGHKKEVQIINNSVNFLVTFLA